MEITDNLGEILIKLEGWQLFIIILLWIALQFFITYKTDRPIRIIETNLNDSYEDIKKLLINFDKNICDLNSKIENLVKSIKYDIIIKKLEKILTKKFMD